MRKHSQLKPGSKSGDPIYVNKHIFLGRVEEQKHFRNVLSEVLNKTDEELPWVVLLYGDGGMGKTTLAARFRDIAQGEEPFAGAFEALQIDWEDLRRRHIALQSDRESITPEAVFDALYAAVPQDWKDYFKKYQEAVKLRAEAEKKASEAMSVADERDSLSELRGLGAGALAKLARQNLPVIGETGEKAVEALSKLGIKVAEDKARNVIASLNTRLRSRLKAEQLEIFLNPHDHLARALADGLKKLTGSGLVLSGKPLIVTLDTYEIVDRVDVWMRLVMRHAGPRVLWLVCGRNNLRDSRTFGADYINQIKGYSEEWPRRRLLDYNMPQLALDDVRTWFASEAPEHPLNEAETEAISRATRGIPLAIHEAAEMRQRGLSVDQIIGDTNDATPTREIITRMTERYLLHAINNEDDRRALYALALAQGDRERLRAMLRPRDDQPFNLEDRLKDLERDYASVHSDENRLHDAPALFFRERLKRSRDEDWAQALNRRAIEALRARLRKLEAGLPRLEDRCDDEDWNRTAVALADHLFWLEETEGWRWFAPRFVESLAYSAELRKGLLDIVGDWKAQLRSNGQKRLRLFGKGADLQSDAEDQDAMLDQLDRLAELGWMKESEEDACELERRAILDWRRGESFYRLGTYTEALASYECAEKELSRDGEILRRRLAESFNSLGWKLGLDRGQAIPSVEAEAALKRATSLNRDNGSYWVGLGVMQYGLKNLSDARDSIDRGISLGEDKAWAINWLGNVYSDLKGYEEAIAAYGRAIELDPKDAYPHNGLGNVYRDLKQYEEAIAAYGRAIELNPKDAYPHNGLGIIYQLMKQYAKAEEAFRKAVELNPQSGTYRSSLIGILRKLGQESKAAEQIKFARELIAKEDAYNRACFEAICGNADEALLLLKMALEKRETSLEWAELDPDFDSLRGDTRFAELIEEMKARFAAG